MAGQVKQIDDVLPLEPLVLQRLERSLLYAVLAWRLDPGANVPQLGMRGDERGESKRPERVPSEFLSDVKLLRLASRSLARRHA